MEHDILGVAKHTQKLHIRLTIVDHEDLARLLGQIHVPAQRLLLDVKGCGGLWLVLNPIGIEAGLPDCHAAWVRSHFLQPLPRRGIERVGLGGMDGAGCPHVGELMCRLERTLGLFQTITYRNHARHPCSTGAGHDVGGWVLAGG